MESLGFQKKIELAFLNNRIGNKSIEQQSYYAVPESDEMDDDDNPKKNKRGKVNMSDLIGTIETYVEDKLKSYIK